MARRHRTRGQFWAAEVREALAAIMTVFAFAGGLWLLGALAASLHIL